QNDHSKDSSGAVYLFVRNGTAWSQQAYLKASNPGEGDQFGISLSLNADGSTLAVGAIEEGSTATGVNGNQADHSKPGAGAAYVFSRADAKWSQQAYVKPDALGELFGMSVGLSANGDTLVAGAPNQDSGDVYVFVRSGANWSKQAHMQ